MSDHAPLGHNQHPTDSVAHPIGAVEQTSVPLHDESVMAVRKPGPVTLDDREGVWVHSFKCSVCDLEFALFSWLPNRHGVGRTHCPECGGRTPMLHWRGQTSTSAAFGGGGTEIYQMSPLIDGPLLDDSIPPDEDRYDFTA